MTRDRLAALLAAALVPGAAGALERRTDHRDTHGPWIEALLAHDTVTPEGEDARGRWRPALRAAWGFDVSGEGDELSLGIQGSPGSDPDGSHVRLALDARYRGYFGIDAWKTFFDVGIWAPVSSFVSVGPLVGLGVAWDPSRAAGVYLAGTFATAFGEARAATFTIGLGAQLRFE
jgi:hypothetical protein